MHVTHAKRAYTVNTAVENTRTRHLPTNNAYVLQYSDTVGSYGTRNVVGIGIISWERPTDSIDLLMICLSSILRGTPFLGAFA